MRVGIILVAASFSILIVAAPAFAQVPDPIGAKSFPDLINTVAKAVMRIGEIFAVVAIMVVGFKFLAASISSNPKDLQDSKKMLWWVLIGTAIVVGASVLAQAVVNTIKNLGGESSSSSFSAERSQSYQEPSAPKDDDAKIIPGRSNVVSFNNRDPEDKSLQETIDFFKEHGSAEDISGFQDLHLPSSFGISPDGQVLVRDDKKIYGTYDISEGPGAKLLKKTCPACLVLGGDVTEGTAKELAEKIKKTRGRLGESYGRYFENSIMIPASPEVDLKIKRDMAQHYAEIEADILKFAEGRGRRDFVERRAGELLDKGDVGKGKSLAFSDGSVYLDPAEKELIDHGHDDDDTLVHEFAHIKTFEKLGVSEGSLKSFREQLQASEAGRDFLEIYDKSLFLSYDNAKVANKVDAGFCSDYGSTNAMESIAECVTVATSGGPYYNAYAFTQFSEEEKRRFPEIEQRNKVVSEGNKLRYEHYKLLHQHGFIPKLPPAPPNT